MDVLAVAAGAGVPVELVFMHGGGHGGHPAHGAAPTQSDDKLHATNSKHCRA